MHFFELVHDYQLLRAKGAMVPLDEGERAQLAGLLQMLRGDAASDERRATPRLLCPLPVHLSSAGFGFVRGALRNVSGDGAALEAEVDVAPGDTLLVHLDAGRTSYRFPAEVVWRRGSRLGLRFEGRPGRAEREGFRAA